MNDNFAIELRDIGNVFDDTVIYKEDYVVYRSGKVWSLITHKYLKPRVHTHGYLRLYVKENGKTRGNGKRKRNDEYIHRMVAFCFVDNPCGYKEINHIDGDKKNNNASNLEWCSRSHNNKHAFVTGLRDYAELKAMANCEKHRLMHRKRRIYDDATALQIRGLIRQGMSDRDIANKFGGTRGAICSIRKGKSYKDIYEYTNTAN